MGLGFVIARFGLYLRELRPGAHPTSSTGFSTIIGTALVVCGAVVIAVATALYARTGEALERNVYRWSPAACYVLAGILVVVAALLSIYLVATA
jgi:putative membrane protein